MDRIATELVQLDLQSDLSIKSMFPCTEQVQAQAGQSLLKFLFDVFPQGN